MRVLFLGGGGDMAASMIDLMKVEDNIEAVTLADLDGEKVAALAREAGNKFSAIEIDVTHRELLVEMMNEHDLALSYVGPFYRFEKPVAQAAIDAGVHYISIADDYDAYLQVAELEKEARQAGVKILTGFGNSPGLTQMLAHVVEKPATLGEMVDRDCGATLPQRLLGPPPVDILLGLRIGIHNHNIRLPRGL